MARSALFRLAAALAAGSFGAAVPAVHAAPTAPRPNIVFILTDDLGFGDLGVYYQNSRDFATNRYRPAHRTPRLDAFAAGGLRFERHYSPAPVCAPARASFLTGQHQGHSTVRDNQFDAALEDTHTVASVLRGAGYATAAIGKWGLQGGTGAPGHPLQRGFDSYFGMLAHLDGHYHYPKESGRAFFDGTTNLSAQLDKCYSTDLLTARAKLWIVSHHAATPARPFFLYLAYTAPHARLEVPTQAWPAGRGLGGGVQWTGTPGAMINTASGVVDSWIHPDYATATWDHDNNPATAEQAWPAHARRHATMVRRLDDAVDDLLGTLEDLGLDQNTLVVFTSDNGPHNEAGNGGTVTQDPRFFRTYGPLDGIKRDVWEGGIRVPTLARWPAGLPAGRVSTRPSQFHDWLATFAELAGVPAPARSDGVSLVPELSGAGVPAPGVVYVEYFVTGSPNAATPNYADFAATHRSATRGQMQAVYLGGYKGVRYNIGSASTLFRVHETGLDPGEAINLAGTPGVPTQTEFEAAVLRLRRAGGGSTRPYDAAPVPARPVAGLVAGLDYAAHEGAFAFVPDFSGLAPVLTGTTTEPGPGVLTRGADAGAFFSGWLEVPADGDYQFFARASGGVIVRLHDALLIDADAGYVVGAERASGTIPLRAGTHPIRIHYRHTSGPPALTLAWSGPGLAKAPVPAAAFLRSGPPGPPVAVDDTASTPRDTSVLVPVLANDLHPGGGAPALTLAAVGPASGGTAVAEGAAVRFTPVAGFLGQGEFYYTVAAGALPAEGRARVAVTYADALKWLPLNEVSGLVAHEAGGTALGRLEGFGGGAGWTSGRHGGGLALDGVSQNVRLSGYNGIGGAGARTVSAWVKTTGHGPLVAWGELAAGKKWILRVQEPGAGFVAGAARVEVEGGYVVGTRTLADGQWHHVAAVLPAGAGNVSGVLLYVDGVAEALSAVQAQAINTSTTQEVWLGADMQGRFLAGVLDEVRIEPGVRSAGELAALAAAGGQVAASWHRRHFGAAAVDWTADDDADGLPRLREFFAGASPWLVSGETGPVWDAGLAGGSVALRMNAAAGEVAWRVETSVNLSDWSALALDEWGREPTADGAAEWVEWGFAVEPVVPAPTRRFYRLHFTAP